MCPTFTYGKDVFGRFVLLEDEVAYTCVVAALRNSISICRTDATPAPHECAAKGCHPGQASTAPECLPLSLHQAPLRNRAYRISYWPSAVESPSALAQRPGSAGPIGALRLPGRLAVRTVQRRPSAAARRRAAGPRGCRQQAPRCALQVGRVCWDRRKVKTATWCEANRER